MSQAMLFSGAVLPPHRIGHDTQTAAAARVCSEAPSMRSRIYADICSQGRCGRTNDEIAASLGMLIQTVCGRVRELQGSEFAGLPRRIVDSGMRRKTRTGCSAIVWVATQ